jgi:eukaryotic translation initiation factor 2C
MIGSSSFLEAKLSFSYTLQMEIPGNAAIIRTAVTAPPATPLPEGIVIPKRPLRPAQATTGRPTSLLTNWFPVQFTQDEAYQYAFTVTKINASPFGGRMQAPRKGQTGPPALPPRICREAFQRVADELGWKKGSYAFDGRSLLFSIDNQLLASVKGVYTNEFEVALPGERRPTHVSVKVEKVAIISFTALRDYVQGRDSEAALNALQCLDVVLKSSMGFNSLTDPNILTGARFFLFYNQQAPSLGGGAQIWQGYKQALRPCQSGLALTLDSATAAVWDVGNPSKPKNLAQIMNELLRDQRNPPRPGQPLDRTHTTALDRAIRGLKVRAIHNGFKRTVKGLSRNTPWEEFFEVPVDEKQPDGAKKKVSVADYFKDKYQITLTERHLPCVTIGNGQTFLPAEVADVLPGQRQGKLNGRQTSAMIKIAAQKPDRKLSFIREQVQRVNGTAKPEMDAFGLKLTTNVPEVKARILDNPLLDYANQKRFDPRNTGAWNMKGLSFVDANPIKSWCVISFVWQQDMKRDLNGFVEEFARGLDQYKVKVPKNNQGTVMPPLIEVKRDESAFQAMNRGCEAAETAYGAKPSIIIVILADDGVNTYRDVKQTSDSLLGIPSQCMVAAKIGLGRPPRGREQYIANVAMKVNAKLGGRNNILSQDFIQSKHFLQFWSRPFIVFGADVTHPPAGAASDAPAVAAVVASWDATVTRYAARVSVQQRHPDCRDIILELKQMVKELLIEFYRASRGHKPERILFYRDGVSNGEFDAVIKYEYRAIREACMELGDGQSQYAPPISFIAVQKRHNTRFFPTSPQNADRSGNVMPGSVIDTNICHPFEWDFYLNSHAGLQGTNKPVHYHVLCDENKLTADGLQLMTYWLTYLFCRCTRSISVVAPCQYAHLSAFRASLSFRATFELTRLGTCLAAWWRQRHGKFLQSWQWCNQSGVFAHCSFFEQCHVFRLRTMFGTCLVNVWQVKIRSSRIRIHALDCEI